MVGRSYGSKFLERYAPIVTPALVRVTDSERATEGENMASASQETGQVTGTADKDYNIIWFTEQCLSNVLRLEQYVSDAERDGDSDLAEFFRRAQGASRKGAEEGKALLRQRLSS